MDRLKATIVIPTYNRKDKLKELLDRLQREDYPREKFEIIVIDDGSSDGTVEFLKSYSPSFNMVTIFHKENKGSAASRNDGIKAASNQIIIFLDDDLVTEPGIIFHHTKHHYGKKCAVIGDIRYQETFSTRWISRYLSTRGVHKIKPGKKIPFKCFWTSNASVKKEQLLAVSLFDERFRGAGGEDTDIAYRLERLGVEFVYEKDAVCYHCPVSLDELLRKQEDFASKALPLLIEKEPVFKRVFKVHLLKNPFFSFLTIPFVFQSVKLLAHIIKFLYLPPLIIDYLIFCKIMGR
jgi:glycosyltransferase involved in cell wall biosynthesis